MRRFLNHSLLAAAVVFATACNLDVAPLPTNEPSDPTTETFNPGLQVDIPTMQKTASGVYYKDLTVGSGASLTISVQQQVFISFAGFLKTGAAFTQTVNTLLYVTTLPPGLQDGISGMRAGGERIVVVPSALGYGAALQPGVPPNSTLVFDVILDQIP